MKRASENVEGASENSGIKRSMFSNGIDENSGALQRTADEEQAVLVTDSAVVDNDGGFFGVTVPADFAGPSFSYLEEANKWDFDINFDRIFMNEEQQQGLGFDLNLPVSRNEDVRGEKGSLECTQGLVNSQDIVEIIDITSGDSDNEVEIIGYNYRAKGKEIEHNEGGIEGYYSGYGLKGKGMEVGMPSDRMENLAEILSSNNVGGENSFLNGGKRRYTMEEKGKARMSYSWLSLKPDGLIDWEFLYESNGSIRINEPRNIIDVEEFSSQSDGSIRISEPRNDIDVQEWRPATLPNQFDELALSQEEEYRRRIEASHRESLREVARKFARAERPVENDGNGSSIQKQTSPTLRAADQLGKSPGPFSDALKMIHNRTSKRVAEQLIEWKPSEGSEDHCITKPFVPSLLDLSVKVLAANAHAVVSLELVPDVLRRKLADALCDMNGMNGHIMKLLVEGCPTEIHVKNCSWLTEKQFHQTFDKCQTNNLRVLQLDLIGQCMLDIAFGEMLARSPNSFSSLAIVSLRGACRLTDSGVKQLVTSAPALRSINLGHCNLLTCDAINFIADSLGSNLRELYVDECPKINAMLILPAFEKFKHLEVLSVAGIRTVTDQFIGEMITLCGCSIKELDLANCEELTDWSLKTIGSHCADLCSLDISNLANLTDMALEYLANGCRSIQKLKLLRNGFSDEAMAAFLETSGESLMELLMNSVTKVGPNTALSLARCSRKLLYLDISWCRRISNEALGLIVDSCSSLTVLKVFGCKQITSVFLKGHSNPLVRIIGLSLTPLLDHVNLLERDEVLLRYSPLPI